LAALAATAVLAAMVAIRMAWVQVGMVVTAARVAMAELA
jgi:hypothetical protein